MNDKRTLLAIGLCVLFYLAYSQYLSHKYPNYGKPGQQTEKTGEEEPSKGAPAPKRDQAQQGTESAREKAPQAKGETQTPTAQPADVTKLDDSQLTLETDKVRYEFSQDLSGIERVVLKDYREGNAKDSSLVNLAKNPLIFQGITDIARTDTLRGVFHAERKGRSLKFWRDSGTWRIAQTFHIPEEGYGAEIDVSFTNTGDRAAELTAGLLSRQRLSFKDADQSIGFLPGIPVARKTLLWNVDGDTDREDFQDYCEEAGDPIARFRNAPVGYYGIDHHYFLKTLLPQHDNFSVVLEHGEATQDACEAILVGYEPFGLTQVGETVTISFRAFFGPKKMSVMNEYNEDLGAAIDLGFFSFISRPLLMVIHGFHSLTGNYGVAIVILTLLLKILFYPLMKASSVSMHKMKKLNPQMQEIREKYKDDRQRQQQELMKFMSQHKINPMKGCLPILPQIPVFFAFYQVLRTAIELRHAPFFGWIQDLSAPDPFFVTPILMGAAMLGQQKLTPTTGMDKTQEKILMFMPVMFTAMMLTLPAGMTLYMLTNTVIGIAQQKWLYKKLDKMEA